MTGELGGYRMPLSWRRGSVQLTGKQSERAVRGKSSPASGRKRDGDKENKRDGARDEELPSAASNRARARRASLLAPMWIKICGTTTLDDALLAARAGANAVGFIFAPSPRRVSPEAVALITARLPRTIEKFGVFVDAGFDEIVSAVKQAGLSGVQLHSSPDPGLPLRLREHFSGIPARPRLGILQVLHFSTAGELDRALEPLRYDHAVDAVLIDSRTATAVGGTGQAFDWAAAAEVFRRTAPHLRLLAAGGLSPENVAKAIDTLHPWGVDVVTGVEAAPGRKDPARVGTFIARARASRGADR